MPNSFTLNFICKDSKAMSTRWIWVIVLLLILPSLSDRVKTSCEIPSVELGEYATLSVHFGEDLSHESVRDFSVLHIDRNLKETQLLSCVFTYGNVTCHKTSCCTWESHVTDVFRVYIHNVSQELEGRFWGFVIPADGVYQKHCNFALKASTCSTDSINATNSHLTCNNQSIPIGQTCSVNCNPGHYFQDNQTSVLYTCVGKNKWYPEMPAKSCELYTCSRDAIIELNSRVICNERFLSIGETCTVICNVGHYYQENEPAVTLTCVGKNKWSPEIPVISCKEKGELSDLKTYLLYIFFTISTIGHAIAITIDISKKWKKGKMKTDLLLPIQCTETQDMTFQQPPEDYRLHCIRKWYPKLQSRTYFLPPLHFNHVWYDMKTIAAKQVSVPQIPQDSDMLDDRTLDHVLHCLRTLAVNPQQKELMMVISQLKSGIHYGKPSYAAAALGSLMPEQLCQYDKGDCDVLIIHSKLGLLTFEIKNVGGNFNQLEMTQEEDDDLVMEKVYEAVNQLNKAGDVLTFLTSGTMASIHITKILVLPNISSTQLLRAINRTPPDKRQILYQCLGVQNVADALRLCLLSDQLSHKHMSSDVYHNSLPAFTVWWQQLINASGSKSFMTPSLYEQLVARFCYPAVTVVAHCVIASHLNIKTLGEAVSETGERMARLILSQQIVDILNQSPPQIFLTGPPGTGKTIVLIMQGLDWIRRGHDVHVVSTWDGSRAVTFVIERQVMETANQSKARSRVHRHQFDFGNDGEVETAVRRLECMSEGRQLCVIADEGECYRESFTQFCDQLINEIPGVYIWGASVYHGIKPSSLEEVKLTIPLRSPPVVIREVMEAKEIKDKEIYDYTVSDVPVPTDGPPVIRIKHRDGQSGHTEVRPFDCVECGHEVAFILTDLNVGQTGGPCRPPPLKYRDVLVLYFGHPIDDLGMRFCRMITSSGLVRGLRDYHVPVRVVKEGDTAAIHNTALGVGDMVTVADWDEVRGLERKVVVVESIAGSSCRLFAMSRCTSQLVVIDC